jgi:hypothetical protein
MRGARAVHRGAAVGRTAAAKSTLKARMRALFEPLNLAGCEPASKAGPRSSEDSEIVTHAACLLLRRKVCSALAKPTEPLGRLLARFGWSRTITLKPIYGLTFSRYFLGGDGGCPHQIANGEIEADEHHERNKPLMALIALGRTVREDKNATVARRSARIPARGAKF